MVREAWVFLLVVFFKGLQVDSASSWSDGSKKAYHTAWVETASAWTPGVPSSFSMAEGVSCSCSMPSLHNGTWLPHQPQTPQTLSSNYRIHLWTGSAPSTTGTVSGSTQEAVSLSDQNHKILCSSVKFLLILVDIYRLTNFVFNYVCSQAVSIFDIFRKSSVTYLNDFP